MTEKLEAWGIMDEEGNILVRTITDTPVGAMVNWLITERQTVILQGTPDAEIGIAFAAMSGASECVELVVTRKLAS